MTIVTRAVGIAAVVCFLEALALLGFIGFYLYEIAQGASDDAIRALMSVVLMAIFGVGLAAMGRGWLRHLAWPRTPTIVWNVLLLPVAVTVYQSGQTLIAIILGGVALTGIAAAIAARTVGDDDASDTASGADTR